MAALSVCSFVTSAVFSLQDSSTDTSSNPLVLQASHLDSMLYGGSLAGVDDPMHAPTQVLSQTSLDLQPGLLIDTLYAINLHCAFSKACLYGLVADENEAKRRMQVSTSHVCIFFVVLLCTARYFPSKCNAVSLVNLEVQNYLQTSVQ